MIYICVSVYVIPASVLINRMYVCEFNGTFDIEILEPIDILIP